MGGNGSARGFTETRLQAYRALFALPRFDLSGHLEAALQALPFKLGESAAEMSVPYAFDDLLVEAAERAIDDLAVLNRRRRENELDPKPLPPGVFAETDTRRLPATGFATSNFGDATLPGRVALRAMRLDPALDAGVLETWLLRGHGGPLLTQLALLFARACDEDVRTRGTTPHLPLTVVAAVNLFESLKGRAKGLVSRVYPWDKLEKSLGLACFALVEACVEEALAGLAGKRLGFDEGLYALRVRAALTPLAWCSVRGRALQNDINPWEISQGFADAADRVWLAMLEDDPNPRTAEQRVLLGILEDRELRLRAARAGAILAARRRLLDWLEIYDGLDLELSGALVPLAGSDEALYTLLADPKAVVARIQKFARGRKTDAAGEAATAALLDALRRGTEREETIRDVAGAYTCLALDRVAVSAVDAARSRLKDRRVEYGREQLISDYQAGRLYRLSADGREFRRVLTRKSQGHLFVDLKGFTQRTYRAKEIVMAEFLRTEFYEPILAAAAQRAIAENGEPQLVLQNLLGDAAVFSGEVPALVELAKAIQGICRAYGDKLRSRVGTTARDAEVRRQEIETNLRREMDALRAEASRMEAEIARKLALPPAERERALWTELSGRIADLEARHRQALADRDDGEAARALEAVRALRHHEKEVFGRVENLFGQSRDDFVSELAVAGERRRLKELERRAAEARRSSGAQVKAIEEEVRASQGYGLEAGTFITYGAAAESAAMSDPVFGAVRVAIAEKINEAARGTARNGILKGKLDALLGRARAARNNPGLEYPFRVQVDSAYNLLLPADLSDLVDRAVRDKDPDRAREAARRIAEGVLRDLARSMGMGDGQPPESLSTFADIYNTGEALTAEALTAYLKATTTHRLWFRKVLSVAELDREFHDLFFFNSDELELVVSVPQDGDADHSVIFRRAGQVQFRGFEAKTPTTVYELLRPDSPFVLLLAQKHLALWAAEARSRRDAPSELPS